MTTALKDLTLKAARHWVVNLILRTYSYGAPPGDALLVDSRDERRGVAFLFSLIVMGVERGGGGGQGGVQLLSKIGGRNSSRNSTMLT